MQLLHTALGCGARSGVQPCTAHIIVLARKRCGTVYTGEGLSRAVLREGNTGGLNRDLIGRCSCSTTVQPGPLEVAF